MLYCIPYLQFYYISIHLNLLSCELNAHRWVTAIVELIAAVG